MYKKLIIRTDGGARGNPGPAAIGVVIEDESGKIIKKFGKYLGVATNNQAEYQALYDGLEIALSLGAVELACYLDSELVVKQMKLEYKVKNKDLALQFIKVWNLVQKFKKVSFNHVPRAKNSQADFLVNEALDSELKKLPV